MSLPERSARCASSAATPSRKWPARSACRSHSSNAESGASQPTIEVFRRIVLALNVSADTLLFEDAERGPDESLKLQFEAVSHLDPHEREAVQTMIAGVLHMHDAKRWQLSANAPAVAREPAPAKASAKRKAAVR